MAESVALPRIRARGDRRITLIAPIDPALPKPLSYSQQRLWFLDQYEPGSSIYNVPIVLRISGALSIAALQVAIAGLVTRHEVLRSVFRLGPDGPTQVVLPELDIPINVADFSDVELVKAREQEVRRFCREEALRPFSLELGPLLRVNLVRLSGADQILAITMHHIVVDEWSLEILFRELDLLYRAAMREEAPSLPELPIQYADYAAWQRDFFNGGAAQKQLSFWEARLANTATLDLPTDRPRPSEMDGEGGAVHFTIPDVLTESLRRLCRSLEITSFMALLAAFQLVLSRWSGQTDVVVGTPIANRGRRETEGLIGCFLNTLVMRGDLSGNPSLREILQRTKQMAIDAYANQDLPFEVLVERLAPVRDPTRTPLFQVMFVLKNGGGGPLPLFEAKCVPFDPGFEVAKFDLMLSLSEDSDRIRASFSYAKALYDQGTIERMRDHFLAAVGLLVSDLEQSARKADIFPASERKLLLHDWNSTDQSRSEWKSILDLFAEQVAQTPFAPALVMGAQRLSYREIDEKSDAIARLLGAENVRSDQVVALCLQRSVEMVVAVLGVLKAGAAYAPLDPSDPQDRLSAMIAEIKPVCLLTQAHLVAGLPVGQTKIVAVHSDDLPGAMTFPPASRQAIQPGNLAYVIFTSGSTGRPKGVAMPHAALSNLLNWQIRESASVGRSTLQFTSLTFDPSFLEMFSCFCTGGTLFLISEDTRRDMGAVMRQIRHERIERLFLPYVALNALAEAYASERPGLLPLLEINTAGEQLRITPAILSFFDGHKNTKLTNQYGPSETQVATFHRLDGQPGEWPHLPPIGVPIDNTQIYILDEMGELAPIGAIGDIHIGGDCLARGYLNRPGLTAERFVPNPFGPSGSRLYRSGDRGRYLPNGEIQFLGRLDLQVKIRGFRVELGEIEAALDALPSVQDAAVTVFEARENDKQLVAYVVPFGERKDVHALKEMLATTLPEYMIPGHFVFLDEFPLTPTGKVDRKRLPPPLIVQADQRAPETEDERALEPLFAEVLNLPAVGVDANFFEIGGHSLLAIKLISLIRGRLGHDLSVRALFDAPTISALAPKLRQAPNFLPSLTALPRPSRVPLSFAQGRLWFIYRLLGPSAVYNLPFALRFGEGVEVATLSRALSDVLGRHESLRTTFHDENGDPEQIVLPPESAVLHLERSFVSEECLAQEINRAGSYGFRLEMELPIKLWLFNSGGQSDVLVIVTHHIASDGWSMDLLVRDLMQAYEARRNGIAPDWFRLPVQYADYALWQRKALDGTREADRQLRYWRQKLRGIPTQINLPADRARPVAASHDGAAVPCNIDPSLYRALSGLARESGATLFMLLHAAIAVLLSRHGAGSDIPIGSPIAGRTEGATHDLVGFFVNTLVFRTDVSGSPTFLELLARVRDTCLEAYDHQDVPFEWLVEQIAPPRTQSHHPLFQVFLALQTQLTPIRDMSKQEVTYESVTVRSARFDLAFNFSEHGGTSADDACVWGELTYATDLFDRETAKGISARLGRLLKQIAARPDMLIRDLDIVTPDERNALLVDRNDTGRDLRSAAISELFERQVQSNPAAAALSISGKSYCYDDINRSANRLARHLVLQGASAEVVIGVCLSDPLQMVRSLLAVTKAGAIFLPIDPNHPLERVRHILKDAGPRFVICDDSTLQKLDGVSSVILGSGQAEEALREIPSENLDSLDNVTSLPPEAGAYLIYTSGSTGMPKGVLVPHKGIASLVVSQSERFDVRPGARVLQVASASVDAMVAELLVTLLSGATLVLKPPAIISDIGKLVAQERVSHVTLTPSVLPGILEQDFKGCSTIILAGEACPAHTAGKWAKGRNLINAYGPTEYTVCTTIGAPFSGAGAFSIGTPILNAKVYVLDEDLKPVPPGVPGELYISGPGLARGYVGKPALTAERFLPCPFEPGGCRMYRTGDIVRWQRDGNLDYLGRADDQIKIRGFRVEPSEVEAAVLGLACVTQALVVSQEIAGSTELVAYVKAAAETSPSHLRHALVAELPDYMIPRHFVLLDVMPMTDAGKIDRRRLPQALSHQTPPESPLDVTRGEERLLGIWRDITGGGVIDVNGNFFDHGGTSLLMLKLHSAIALAFSTRIEVVDLFRYPTVALLAKHLGGVEGRASGGQLKEGVSGKSSKSRLMESRRRLGSRGNDAGGERET